MDTEARRKVRVLEEIVRTLDEGEQMDKGIRTEVNTLLAYLRQFDVVRGVKLRFGSVGNDAPAFLLQKQMDKLQRMIEDKANEPAAP